VEKSGWALEMPAFFRIEPILASAPHFRHPGILTSITRSAASTEGSGISIDNRKVESAMKRIALYFKSVFPFPFCGVFSMDFRQKQIYSLDRIITLPYIGTPENKIQDAGYKIQDQGA
jgi:hypothetical protein